MNQANPPQCHWPQLIVLCLGWLLSVVWLHAQSAANGTISGRIFNPVTGEYVRNAEVHILGTERMAISEHGGHYSFANVPEGEVTLTVHYTGYFAAPAKVKVGAGAVATRDFDLFSTDEKPQREGEPLRLHEFVVSAEREGNAKAIMDQRQNMNISNILASDAFGDVAEGNVGEFLKYLPDVDMEYSGGDARAPRIHGLDPQYTAVTLDGMNPASADVYMAYNGSANVAAGEGTRSFGFELISLNSIESVEIFKGSSADMAANAPAGTINLKTKRAFDRKGRRIGWQISAILNSNDFHLKKTYGPFEDKNYKLRPGAILDYSDVFLNNRLGILLNLSESNQYAIQHGTSVTTNTTPTPADPRPMVVTSINSGAAKRFTHRFATTLTIDFKATPNLAIGLVTMFNDYSIESDNVGFTITAAANNTGATGRSTVTGDGILTIGTSATAGGSRTAAMPGSRGVFKVGHSLTLMPNLQYKRGNLTIDARGSYSSSVSLFRGTEYGAIGIMRLDAISGVDFQATRSDPLKVDWTVHQTGGPDWSDLANYPNPRISDDRRDSKTQEFDSKIDARFNTSWKIPAWIKTGISARLSVRDYENTAALTNYNYVGPSGEPIRGFGAYPQPFTLDMGSTNGGEYFGLSGKGVVFPNRKAATAVFRDHPEYFQSTTTAENWYTGNISSSKDYEEQINAAYLMAYGQLGRWKIQSGLRWEETNTASKEFDPLPPSQVKAAGFTVGSNNRATTVPGLIYQYQSNPRVIRSGSYDNFFPSVAAKYGFRRNLVAHLSYNKAILRPSFNAVTGLWVIDETNRRVTVPNPGLLPENSDNYLARLEYFFEPVGRLAIGGFLKDIKHLRERGEFTAEEFGYNGDEFFDDYTFVTQTSGAGKKKVKGYSVEYRQLLRFLPGPLGGLGVFANYTRNIPVVRRVGVAPHQVTGGVDFKYRRLNLGLKGVWAPRTPWSVGTANRFREEQAKYDLNGGFQLTDRVALFFQGRNITNQPTVLTADIGNLPPVLLEFEDWGAVWTFGIRGSF